MHCTRKRVNGARYEIENTLRNLNFGFFEVDNSRLASSDEIDYRFGIGFRHGLVLSQGVRVMNLEEDNKVIGIVAVEAEPESEETDGEDGENTETAENIPQTETEQEYTEE